MSAAGGCVYLMYHEIEVPGRRMCQDAPGYVRYVVSEQDFRKQMQALKDAGLRGMSVSKALASKAAVGIVLTFDDGCETDLIVAAPILRELGFNATCYATVDFLDKRGYLSRKQLHELSDLGVEVGSHSMTHPYLSDLEEEELKYEISGSKQALEQITGRAVHHFSCPGGRWDSRVASTAREAGYRSVATSRLIANFPDSDPFALGRVAIVRGIGLPAFRTLSEGRGLWKLRLKDSFRSSLKRALGNATYDRLRARLLDRSPETR
jgi:peptidoglycan/xylan/chitin deacetylase (PgdA/CDA1 family)